MCERAFPLPDPPAGHRHPTHMCGQGEASGVFALECAMDEPSYALGIDPLDFGAGTSRKSTRARTSPSRADPR